MIDLKRKWVKGNVIWIKGKIDKKCIENFMKVYKWCAGCYG